MDTAADIFGSSPRDDRSADHLATEIELLTESFYYVAFRLEGLLGDKLKLMYRPKKIRRVRNQLIEHPEKAHGPVNPNFTFGSDLETGPIIKQFGERGEDAHNDEGLYVNAGEAIERLAAILRSELDRFE